MTDPTLPRADEVLAKSWGTGKPELQVAALFACLPPDSDHLVIRRSDLAVMGLEFVAVYGDGRDRLHRLVAPGSPTVPESEAS